MNIDDIKPYPRNARHNEKAIPVVAESIKEFGFKGAIVLRSREDPTIVNGHTRVAACKLLGWTEFPDEYIRYADDLTDEQVRALRLADNRTGEVATWNKALLKNEIKSISDLDMAKFDFDFKSKVRPYGAERMRTDDAYNLDMVSRLDCGRDGFPKLPKADARPAELQGFNYAKSTPRDQKRGKGLHFFIDDYQFERVWTSPARYLDVLRGYDCVLTPDFSLYMDMPDPMQEWNRYRSAALGNYWADNGITVVPTLSWAQPSSYMFCFKGIPKHSTVATSTVGVARDEGAQKVWHDGMREAMRRLEPSRVLLYGKNIGFDFGGCEVVEYKAGGFHGR